MRYALAGSGNIACFMGERLKHAGHTCTGLYSRNAATGAELATRLGCKVIDEAAGLATAQPDFILLAVRDSGIWDLAAMLPHDCTIVHTAGAVPVEGPGTDIAHKAVLWPVYSISRDHLPQHREIPCAWEATTLHAKEMVLALAAVITDQAFEARYAQRKWLHVAAVVGNNFINHLMTICEQVCIDNNLPFTVLLPILQQTFDRLQSASPREVQTGPAKRNDEITINKHLQLLEEHPAWQDVYRSLSNSITDTYR